MKNKTLKTIIALFVALTIPIIISIYLVFSSYILERKKFDNEIGNLISKAFFSFNADYEKLNDILETDSFYLSEYTQKTDSLYLQKIFRNVYSDYSNIQEVIAGQLIINGINTEFTYSVEISQFNTINKECIISDTCANIKYLRLFGNEINKNSASKHTFFYKGSKFNVQNSLYIDFPRRSRFIIKIITPVILGCLILLILLSAILIYTVKVLLWQKKVSEMKSDFINNITHEFNTPVSTLKISAANISKVNEKYKSEKLTIISNQINSQADRLKNLIKRVINMSDSEKEFTQFEKKKIDLENITENTIKEFKNSYNGKYNNIEFISEANEKIIFGDEFFISTSIMNLLDNAVKYTIKLSEIQIKLFNVKNKIHISFKDNGYGIKASKQKYVFKKFHRLNDNNIYKIQGLGLGLYMSFIQKQSIF